MVSNKEIVRESNKKTSAVGNKAVVYAGEGKVEVQDISYPDLVLRDGPGVNPRNVGRKCELQASRISFSGPAQKLEQQ